MNDPTVEPYLLRPETTASQAGWETIRDLKVREAELRVAVELRKLEEEAKALDARRVEVAAEIQRMGHSESSVALHARLGRRWGLLALGAALLSIGSAWWTVGWFLSLTWEKVLLALSLFVLPLIGWAVFLVFWGEHARKWNFRRIMASLGIVIALASAVAVASLSGARMIGVTIQEEQAQAGLAADPDQAANEDAGRNNRISALKSSLNWIAALAVVLLAIAGEFAAGVAFHEYSKHATLVRTARPFFKEWTTLREAVIENATAQEEARVRPGILYTQLTTEALEREAVLDAEDRRLRAMAPTLKWMVAGVAILLGAFSAAPVMARDAGLAEVTVVVLDLSTSQGASGEFEANVAAVERVIGVAPPHARIVVLAVNEASFSGVPLMSATSPREAGRFGEYLGEWRTKTIRAWRGVAASLGPRAPGSDIAGAVGRAALEFDEAPGAAKRLVLLSDMRQVGRGVNLERPVAGAAALAERLYGDSPVALKAVEVSVLGAHTAGIDERHWRAVRTFWTEYFTRAGADLVTFGPNRRVMRRD